jgi:hypothetical protein
MLESKHASSHPTRNMMAQIPVPESVSADNPSQDKRRNDDTRQIAIDVAYRQIVIVKWSLSAFQMPAMATGY